MPQQDLYLYGIMVCRRVSFCSMWLRRKIKYKVHRKGDTNSYKISTSHWSRICETGWLFCLCGKICYFQWKFSHIYSHCLRFPIILSHTILLNVVEFSQSVSQKPTPYHIFSERSLNSFCWKFLASINNHHTIKQLRIR